MESEYRMDLIQCLAGLQRRFKSGPRSGGGLRFDLRVFLDERGNYYVFHYEYLFAVRMMSPSLM